jgi:hypothetical protein
VGEWGRTINHHQSTIINQPSSINHHQSTIINQPSSINHHQSTINKST